MPARHDRQPRDPTRSDPTQPDTTLRSAITVAGRRVAVFGVAHREQRTPPGNQPVAKQGSEDQKTTDQTHAPRPGSSPSRSEDLLALSTEDPKERDTTDKIVKIRIFNKFICRAWTCFSHSSTVPWPVLCAPAHCGTPPANATNLATTVPKYIGVARGRSQKQKVLIQEEQAHMQGMTRHSPRQPRPRSGCRQSMLDLVCGLRASGSVALARTRWNSFSPGDTTRPDMTDSHETRPDWTRHGRLFRRRKTSVDVAIQAPRDTSATSNFALQDRVAARPASQAVAAT